MPDDAPVPEPVEGPGGLLGPDEGLPDPVSGSETAGGSETGYGLEPANGAETAGEADLVDGSESGRVAAHDAGTHDETDPTADETDSTVDEADPTVDEADPTADETDPTADYSAAAEDAEMPKPGARHVGAVEPAAHTHRRGPPEHVAARRPWGSFGVFVVLGLAGLLFASNARISGGVDARQPQDLAQLVEEEVEHAGEIEAEAGRLQSEVDRLTDAQMEQVTGEDAEQAALVALAAGQVAVTGPGLTVRLWDAPSDVPYPDWVTNDYLVVHQQDLQAVVNSLWAGGAEAMTLQGERVISTSAFRCVGNVLRLHGQIYSPPYEVRVIGDPEALLEALHGSAEIQRYLDYVEAIGLGWSVDEESELTLAAYTGTSDLRYATVLKDEDHDA